MTKVSELLVHLSTVFALSESPGLKGFGMLHITLAIHEGSLVETHPQQAQHSGTLQISCFFKLDFLFAGIVLRTQMFFARKNRTREPYKQAQAALQI